MADKTIINIPSEGNSYTLDGVLYTAAQVRQFYSSQIPSLANMVETTEDSTGPNGTVRTITFKQRTGNKG